MEKFHEKNANISLKKSEILKNAKFLRKFIKNNKKQLQHHGLREKKIAKMRNLRDFASLQNTDENFRSFSRKVSFAANPTLIPSVVSLWKGWRQDITLHTVILAANLNTEHFYFKPSKLRDQNTEIWYKV